MLERTQEEWVLQLALQKGLITLNDLKQWEASVGHLTTLEAVPVWSERIDFLVREQYLNQDTIESLIIESQAKGARLPDSLQKITQAETLVVGNAYNQAETLAVGDSYNVAQAETLPMGHARKTSLTESNRF